jgi:glyoxylase-like metal-dependent hydrolase (beta-lactamase superfamily II)
MDDRVFLTALPVSPFLMNCAVLGCRVTGRAAIIDPGDEAERVLAVAREAELQVSHVLLTHAHIDHVAAVGSVKAATDAPIHLHREDLPLYQQVGAQARAFGLGFHETLPTPDVFVQEGDLLQVGALKLRVRHTPGHSPGSVCYVVEGLTPGIVFCGDVLFAGSIGRTDLWGGSFQTLMESIGHKLMTLPDATIVHSGHGPATTIGEERQTNPFRGDFAV